MIQCKSLNKEFSSKEEMFKELKSNKEQIIALKKSQIQKSCEKGVSVVAKVLNALNLSKLSEQNKGIVLDDNYYYIAVNSTKILDSHDDLHKDGIWDVTVKARQGKNYLLADHKLELDKVIARKEHVEMFIADVPFSMIGKSYQGNTQILVYKVAKDKIKNSDVKEWLDSGDDIEASVRMQYVKIELAMNSTAKGDEEEKKVYDTNIDTIANKDDFDEIHYFWAVSEAKNINESSLVIYGSNGATGQISDKTNEAVEQTLQKETVEQTSQYKGIDYGSIKEKL